MKFAHFLKISAFFSLFSVGIITFGASLTMAASPADVVAKADGIEITEGDIQIALQDMQDQLGGMSDAQRRDTAITYLIDLKLGVKAAKDAKLTDDEGVKRRVALLTDRLLFDEYLEAAAKKVVTEDAMKALYSDTVKNLKPEQEVRARHILVETEDQAKAAIKRLKAGEDFAKVATELSKDPGSGQQGGDLGFFTKERMVPEFSTAAFALDIGKVSEPVKSQFGYHIIKVEEKREKPVPSFEEVKDQISEFMLNKSRQDILKALRAAAKIERPEPAADPAKDQAPAAPQQ
jgi:peptidyl-prolyl cis-trans isomerase C